MDTGTDGYNNILKALGGKPSQSSGLTIQQQSDNYNAFSELMKQGVYDTEMCALGELYP